MQNWIYRDRLSLTLLTNTRWYPHHGMCPANRKEILLTHTDAELHNLLLALTLYLPVQLLLLNMYTWQIGWHLTNLISINLIQLNPFSDRILANHSPFCHSDSMNPLCISVHILISYQENKTFLSPRIFILWVTIWLILQLMGTSFKQIWP